MQKIWNWLVISSADSTKTSLSVKAFLTGAVTIITMIAGLSHIQVGDLTPIIDPIIQVIQSTLAVVASIAFLIGIVRKLVLTYYGEHEGLK